jgi:outer membrane lipoprotein carrier protein
MLAQAPLTLHQVADRVDNHYNRLASLKLNYVEHYQGMGLNRTESGTLFLKKPGRMRWNYNQPEGKVFLLDGKYGWFYTPGDQQAQRIPAKQLDDIRSPLRFLLGHLKIEKELTQISLQITGNIAKITGVPRDMEQRVKALTLTSTLDTGTLTGLKIEEIDGSITEFTFSNLQENLPLRDADFQFTAPAGVSVVEGMPPV